MIRVLLVDDQRLMREGLRILLELEPDIRVVAEAENGLQALEAYEQHRPDVVLMDIRMPEMDGVQATRRLLSEHPEARVLILTTFDDDAYVLEGLRAGALGYLLKDASREELAAAIRTVAAGGALFAPQVAHKALKALQQVSTPPPPDLIEPLTEREREILRLMAQPEQPPDCPSAPSGARNGQELRFPHPGQTGCERPHPGRAVGQGTRCVNPSLSLQTLSPASLGLFENRLRWLETDIKLPHVTPLMHWTAQERG